MEMIYVLYGQEKFLLEQKLKDIKKDYDISLDNMNDIVYDCLETPLKEIIEDCNTPSFFTEYKLVTLKNPFFLTTQKVNQSLFNQVSLIEDYIKNPNPSTILVIYRDVRDFDERKKLVKLLKKEATYMLMEPLAPLQLKATVRKSIKARKAIIEDDAIDLLLSRLPNDLLLISNEVEKLTLYTHHITVESINAIITKPIEEDVFELVSKVMQRKQSEAIQIYKDLMLQNEEPIKLIVLIASQMRLMMQVKTLERKGYNDHEMAKILSVNVFRLKYIRQDSKNYEIDDLANKLNELALLDRDIKTGSMDKKMGLELFLMNIGGNSKWSR